MGIEVISFVTVLKSEATKSCFSKKKKKKKKKNNTRAKLLV